MPSDANNATTDHLRSFTATSSYGRRAMSLYLTSAVQAAKNQWMPCAARMNFWEASLRLLQPAVAANLTDSVPAVQSVQLLSCGVSRVREQIQSGFAQA